MQRSAQFVAFERIDEILEGIVAYISKVKNGKVLHRTDTRFI